MSDEKKNTKKKCTVNGSFCQFFFINIKKTLFFLCFLTMVSRNSDSVSFALGITAGVIAIISLILTCVGISLPTWYVATNANNTIVVGQANLFQACYAPNATQSTTVKLTCVSYNSYSCSTTSYTNTVLNSTAYLSGCINPNSDSSSYTDYDAPIYQTTIDSFYRIRSAAILGIIAILFIFFSAIFAFLTGIYLFNIYLVFIAPILGTIAVIFGICCLATAGSVIKYSGTGFALFVVGIGLETVFITLSSIVAGRLNEKEVKKYTNEDETEFIQRSDAAIVVRRVPRRK